MSILLDETTGVIVQGFTGKIGSFQAQEMIQSMNWSSWISIEIPPRVRTRITTGQS
jgi:succinyl-CoA synthetase alpha subunit